MFLEFVALYYYFNLYNINLCNSCLNVTQSLKDNRSLESNFYKIEKLCLGNQKCYDMFNYSYDYINNYNSNDICYKFNFCSDIDMNNYVYKSPSGKVNVFKKDNNILGYKLSNNSDFKLYWNISFNQEILHSEFSSYEYPNTPLFCDEIKYNILNVHTNDKTYYFNYSNDVPYYIGETNTINKISKIEINNTIDYNSLQKNESYLYNFYNLTHYNEIILGWDNFSTWNCYINGYFHRCCDASINNIVLNSTKLSFS